MNYEQTRRKNFSVLPVTKTRLDKAHQKKKPNKIEKPKKIRKQKKMYL